MLLKQGRLRCKLVFPKGGGWGRCCARHCYGCTNYNNYVTWINCSTDADCRSNCV